MKRIISAALAAVMCITPLAAFAGSFESEIKSYPWAGEAAEYCFNNGIMTGDDKGDMNLGDNITRAQMAKIFSEAFDLSPVSDYEFRDVPRDSWYYRYSLSLQDSMLKKLEKFNGGEYVTRAEFAATLVKASGGQASDSYAITTYSFKDAKDADEAYRPWLETAVANLYMLGDGENFHPNDLLTRAEACAFLYRAKFPDANKTPITGASEVTLAQAQSWARAKGASDLFVDAA